MVDTILIAYATRTGSTKGISEFIGDTLTKLGEKVEIKPVQSVTDLSNYKAIIVGSAIQGSKLMPEAIEFISNNKNELSQKPLGVFLVCMTLAMRNGKKYRSFVSNWLEPVRIIVKPVSEGLFSGILDIQKVPLFSDRFKFKLSVLFRVWTEGDHRDWNEIEGWTKNLKLEIDKFELKD